MSDPNIPFTRFNQRNRELDSAFNQREDERLEALLRPRRAIGTVAKTAITIWVISAFGSLLLFTAVIAVAWHFISKLW